MMGRAAFLLIVVPIVLGLVAGSAAAQQIPLLGQPSTPEWYQIPHAARAGKTEDVEAMLRRGDSPNSVDSEGRNALSYAAASGNDTMVAMLIQAGARLDARDPFGNIPLHWAADNGHIEALRALLAGQGPVDVQNKQGITPLMLAAGRGRTEIVRVLLEAGADPRKQDFTGRDAMGWGASYPATLRLLRDAKPK